MFYDAYECFKNGSYEESLAIFSKLSSESEDQRIKYWSMVFCGRCHDVLCLEGSLEWYASAHAVFPHRAEACYEIGRTEFIRGKANEAESWLQKAKNADRNVSCIRYEGDKYFEKTHELLIEIYLQKKRFNDAEELCYTLANHGNKNEYNVAKLNYNQLFARHYSNAALEFVKAKAINPGKDLVIEMPRGYDGLGDALVFSHIPRLAKETGRYERVFVSNLTKYGRPEYKNLVWETNPYVDGFTDSPGSFTKDVQFGRILEKWVDIYDGVNLMDSIMLLHDIDDRKRGHKPECYHEIKERRDLEWLRKEVVLDIGSRTISTADFNVERFLSVLSEQGCEPSVFIVAKGLTNSMHLEGKRVITPKDIYDWCDIMKHAKEYVCFNSGGYWLSSSLGIKGTHVWIREKNLPAWSYLDHRNVFVELTTICQ